MNKHQLTKRAMAAGAAVLLGGALFQIPSCATGYLKAFNPCGTIFDYCEPYEWDMQFSDTSNFALDPTCSVAYYGQYGDDDLGTCGSGDIYLGNASNDNTNN